MKGLKLLLPLGFSFLFFGGVVLAAPSDILISEVMYDAKGADDKHEWAEIYNNGSSGVTIVTGQGSGSWRFNDGSNHTFTLFQGSATIPGGGFAILADDPATFLLDYSGFSGTIFKVSMALKNDGATLKLSADKGASFFGEVTYSKSLGAAGNGRTLERDGIIFRESYVDGGTPGKPASTPPPPPVYSDAVIVNEVYPDPRTGEEEFVELYNSGSASVDLSTWQLDDITAGGSSPHTIASGTLIEPNSYLVFYGKIALNNDGDSVNLIAPDRKVKSTMSYPSSTKGRSWARDNQGNFVLTRAVTAGAANQFIAPVRSYDVVINEIIPDPSGTSDDELIELKNLSQTPLDLTDWQLDDADGGSSVYTLPENTVIASSGYYVFYNSKTGLGLNNDGDSVRLFWADGTKVGELIYTKAETGESYSRREDGSFEWTTLLTPGSPNQLPVPVASQLESTSQASPPPDSPILENSKSQIPSPKIKKENSDSLILSAVIELPPIPYSKTIIRSQSLPATANEDTIDTLEPLVGSSGLAILLGGIHQIVRNFRKKIV